MSLNFRKCDKHGMSYETNCFLCDMNNQIALKKKITDLQSRLDIAIEALNRFIAIDDDDKANSRSGYEMLSSYRYETEMARSTLTKLRGDAEKS